MQTFEIHLLYHYGTLSIYALIYGPFIHPSGYPSNYKPLWNIIRLAKRCQWPRAAQYPPLISLAPSTKGLEHRVLSPGSM